MNTFQTILGAVAAIFTAFFLYLMWLSPHGVPGLRAIAPDFRLLDMRFHYTAQQAFDSLESLGAEGRAKQQRFWFIDFGFILCFGIVMWAITLNFAVYPWLRVLMLTAVCLRAVLDIAENLLLLQVCRSLPKRRTTCATISGYVTSAKFVALYSWIAGLFVCLFLQAFQLA